MNIAAPNPSDLSARLPLLPGWISSARGESIEDLAFKSGAALAVLDGVVCHPEVPGGLLRERLALRAAESCVVITGRPERAPDLRDEVHLLRLGDLPGPAGAIFVQWRRAVARPVKAEALQGALPDDLAAHIPVWLATGKGCPVAQCSAVLEAVLADLPRAEAVALILADAVLARALGWRHLVPLLAFGLKPRDLRLRGDDLRRACHHAIVSSVGEALRMASDLSGRAARLRAVAPKLRAKGAGLAVDMFLNKDALSPSLALTDLMSDRAARRLCDRLVDLGAVRELTGRASFRLYGV
ncbi:DUF1403 family protein [Primorskyibacter sp. 2E233]|uniref:DUF1403 family protein n=1 Tax=Primorskyibacter sp. 2E233 TaxID=3413431 RepID=UPI003BF3DA79